MSERTYSEQEVGIIRELSQLRGELNKTPSRFELFALLVTLGALVPTVLIALGAWIVTDQQNDFREEVLEIIIEREAAQQKRLDDILSEKAGLLQ